MNENRINIMEPQTPAPAPAPAAEEKPRVEYASVTERFMALLIDYGVTFIPAQLLAWICLKIIGPEVELWQIIGLFVGINLLFVLYALFRRMRVGAFGPAITVAAIMIAFYFF